MAELQATSEMIYEYSVDACASVVMSTPKWNLQQLVDSENHESRFSKYDELLKQLNERHGDARPLLNIKRFTCLPSFPAVEVIHYSKV